MVKTTSTDEKLNRWRKGNSAAKYQRAISKFFGIITLLAWGLFLYKISQTSEYAMQYDENTQASIGYWFVFLAVLTLFALGTWIGKRATSSMLRKLKDEIVSDLRTELSRTEDAGNRSLIESHLRELGA